MQLVDDLQQLARADAAKILIHRSPVVAAEELQRMLDLYQQQFSDKAITVTIDLGSTAQLMADRDKLLQAMRNLFENCWKYTPAGGQVRLTVTDDGRELTVAFHNSGSGIAAEDLPFIFERFFRADRSRSRKDGGFGIGLSIVKQLIEAQGGRVGAESGTENTTVWFALPLG
jgi:signal transduction histidine kinase